MKYSAFFAALTTLATTTLAAPGDVNGFCVVSHCGGKAISCQQNADCNKILKCAQACPKGDGSLSCSEECQTRFGTDQFADLSSCLVSNKCLEPYPVKTYPIPKTTSVDISDLAASTWYVKTGLEKSVDCYAGETMTFTPTSRTISIAFQSGVKTFNAAVSQTSPGVFGITYPFPSFGKDAFYVVGKSDTVLVAIYVNTSPIASARGGYILKKTDEALTADEIAFVQTSLASSGAGVKYETFVLLCWFKGQ